MQTTADIDAIHLHLDAEPGDRTARLVLADMLDEAGDPRAEGYRWFAATGLYPVDDRVEVCPRWPPHRLPWGWRAENYRPFPHACIPEELRRHMRGYLYPSRREAEDALADAFASRRDELLAAGEG